MSKTSTDRFFDAAMRYTVVAGGAFYIGEVLAKYLAPHLPGQASWLRAGCIVGMLGVAVWSQWPRKAAPASPSTVRTTPKPVRHVKRLR